MKINRLNLAAASIAALLTLAPALPLHADAARTLQLAPHHARDLTAEKLSGQDVKGVDGKTLGTIKDFAIAADGSPVYALVSAGGVFGMGDKLRLIPTNALQPDVARGRNGFHVQLDQTRWNQMLTVDGRSMDSGAYRFSREQHDQLSAHFAGTNYRPIAIRGDGTSLVRASTLRGKDVRSGAEEVGEIEGVVIDLNSSSASVLLETEDEFAGSEQTVLIPFNKLALNAPKAEFIPVSLTRDDFVRLQTENVRLQNNTARVQHVQDEPRPATYAASASDEAPQPRKPAVISNPNYDARNTHQDLTPTGRANTRQDPEELLEIGARSVRDLLKAEPAFANARIDVKPQHGHLVLTGTVNSQQLRDRIYATAKGATGFPVLNNITVDLD